MKVFSYIYAGRDIPNVGISTECKGVEQAIENYVPNRIAVGRLLYMRALDPACEHNGLSNFHQPLTGGRKTPELAWIAPARKNPIWKWTKCLLLSTLLICLSFLPETVSAKTLAQIYDITEQCFAVADERTTDAGVDNQDTLVRLNRLTGQSFVIGLTGTRDIEAIAATPNNVLYAANGGQLGVLDINMGRFSRLPAAFGTAGGNAGEVTLGDVDGLSYNIGNNTLYGTHRRSPDLPDLLFAIDIVTGAHIPNFFGPDIDYVEISPITDEAGNRIDNIDDIAFDPVTGILYAAANRGGGRTGGVLAVIDPATGAASRIATFHYPNPNPSEPALAGKVINDVEGLAFFNDGQLYGSTGANTSALIDINKLFRIDKTTGVGTWVGSFPPEHRDYEALDCLTAQAFIHLEQYINGPGQPPQAADEPIGPIIQVNDPISWTYIFTNTGVLTLTEFVLVDEHLGTIGPGGKSDCPPATAVLGPGEGWSCTANGVAQAGQYRSMATVTGYTQEGLIVPRQDVSDADPSHYYGGSLGISIITLTNGQDAKDPDGMDVPQIAPGEGVTWAYIVTNTGSVPLVESAITVTDDILGMITDVVDKGDGDGLLVSAEVWVYQATGTANDLALASSTSTIVSGCDPAKRGVIRAAYKNVGQVSVFDVTAWDVSHYCNPMPHIFVPLIRR